MDGVRRATVGWISTWLHGQLGLLKFTKTDENGCFKINHTIEKGKAKMIVIFRNTHSYISKPLSAIVHESAFNGPPYNNIEINYDNWDVNGFDQGSEEHLYWGAATVLNGIEETRDNENKFGGNVSNRLRVWLSPKYESFQSFALNAKHIPNLQLGNIFSGTLYQSNFAPILFYYDLATFGFGKAVIVSLFPDIFIGINEPVSLDIKETVYHEVAHNMHFNEVGATYWGELIEAEIKAGGHGDQNSDNAELITLCESWAFHAGNTIANIEYFDLIGYSYYEDLEESLNEETNHVPEGLYYDLIDDNSQNICNEHPLVTDNVDGFTDNQVFSQLDQSVESPPDFIQSFINNEVTSPQIESDINTLFNSY